MLQASSQSYVAQYRPEMQTHYRVAVTTQDEGDRFYRVTRTVLGAVYRLLIPVKVVGAEHLPRHGPVILAANHISFFDTVVLMFSVPRRTYFVGKAEYMDSWKTKFLFPAMGMIPIDRAGGEKSCEER